MPFEIENERRPTVRVDPGGAISFKPRRATFDAKHPDSSGLRSNDSLGGIPTPSRLPGRAPTQDAIDLPKMVQVVCRFQADELLDCLPSAYLVDPVALHPPCARDRRQQSQVALA